MALDYTIPMSGDWLLIFMHCRQLQRDIKHMRNVDRNEKNWKNLSLECQ